MVRMRRLLSALFLTLAFTSTGCLRATTTIELKPDGSGTVVQETAMTTQALTMLKSIGSQAQQGGGSPTDIFSEEQAKKAAATMGVTFVSGEPIKTPEMEGYRARYSFTDISQIKVDMQQGAAGAAPGAGKQPPFAFAMDRSGPTSVLTIKMPEQTPGGGPLPGLPAGATSDADKAQAAQALTMMKMMMQGMFVDVSMNVNGRIVKSNVPTEGSKVTLLQLDVDKLFGDPTAMDKLQAATSLKALAGIPGLKVPTEPTVTIEIAR